MKVSSTRAKLAGLVFDDEALAKKVDVLGLS